MNTNKIRYELVPLRLPYPRSSGWLIDTSVDSIPVPDRLTVGRSEENKLRLHSPSVSREHAILEPRDEGLLVTDLTSHNGTFYAPNCSSNAINNGVKIAGQRYFHHNDVIVFPGSRPFKVSTVPGECAEDELRVTHHPAVQVPAHRYELVLSEKGKKKSINIQDGELVLNRKVVRELLGRNDRLIDENRHCTICLEGNELTIKANEGDIKVNGRGPVVRATLQIGDAISIGNLVFRLRNP